MLSPSLILLPSKGSAAIFLMGLLLCLLRFIGLIWVFDCVFSTLGFVFIFSSIAPVLFSFGILFRI